ncbi:two-component system response regulator BaeR (plasmid) [Pacificitalea manganoxidans]|uniref:Two-component system response regulator BaeR n=1 Tax=Pacificitalea manganoxidans TaxID=1411902 RepID=A0A291M4Z0_9RHOB|nr:response regulator [Pacificitalea manganoxidans]ATI43878.1 two-component system response regulator BaeR [Pacificitalea manganoxidans]MDR6310218.1 two-component system response regulator BaeR [Pacificitalea manganoxidans]
MTETLRKILVVEDEHALAEVLRDYLLAADMEVDLRHDGTGAVLQALSERYDLLVLDLMLPGTDGLSICREIRAAGSDLPIIMTTARVEEIDRLLGLELGADDYLCKPYSPRELVARIKAVLRRRPALAPTESAQGQRLSLDLEAWRARVDGVRLDLTRREFSLLATLAARPGKVMSRDQLLDLAFPEDSEIYDRTIDSHVRNIRRKIASVSDLDPIRSVYGVGYAFELPDT